MKTSASFRIPFLLFICIVMIFSCSDDDDHRDSTFNALGEPDLKMVEDYATFKSETWVYARSDLNVVYMFRKSATGCGGSGKWYISRQYYANYYPFNYELYDPQPTIAHEPVVTAVPDQPILISVTVKLNEKAKFDEEIIRVNLFYRAAGDTLHGFDYIRMMIEGEQDSIYIGEIPSDIVTEQGVDYFIEATSDRTNWNKWSNLPEDGFFTVTVNPDLEAGVEKAGYILSTEDKRGYYTVPEPGGLPGRSLPVGP